VSSNTIQPHFRHLVYSNYVKSLKVSSVWKQVPEETHSFVRPIEIVEALQDLSNRGYQTETQRQRLRAHLMHLMPKIQQEKLRRDLTRTTVRPVSKRNDN
jgi:hypothetical protein